MNKVFFLVGSRPGNPVPEIHGPFASKAAAAAAQGNMSAQPNIITVKADLVEVLQGSAP